MGVQWHPGRSDLAAGECHPEQIDNLGEEATVTVEAVDAKGKPGTGTVQVFSTTGSLIEPVTLNLDGTGKAIQIFSCRYATNPGCSGPVRIEATWNTAGQTLTAKTTLTVGEQVAPIGDSAS